MRRSQKNSFEEAVLNVYSSLTKNLVENKPYA